MDFKNVNIKNAETNRDKSTITTQDKETIWY
jgi:hypothetical protein